MEQNLNPGPIASGSQLPPPSPERHKVGPMAAVVIVLILLTAAGLYFWGAKLAQDESANLPPFIPGDDSMQNPNAGSYTPEETAGLPPQSSSDDAASIQADFESMNLDAVNAQTEAELESI